MKKYLLPENGAFYKANLHCHSILSDGKWSVEEIKEAYTAKGYSIIAFTDHDVFLPHNDLSDDNFLALNGYEMEVNATLEEGKSPKTRKTCHMCLIALDKDNTTPVCWHRSKYLFGNAVNQRENVKNDQSLPDYEREYSGQGISDMMQKGREGGFFVTYNHPTWSLESYPEYISYNNMNAMEIVNGACIHMGYNDYNERIYDDMLRSGKRIFCIAADDNHNVADRFGGFTMIKADKLEYSTITQALVNGDFYASQGPVINSLWIEDNVLHVECEPAAEIRVNTGVRRTAHKNAKDGVGVTSLEYTIEPTDEYFRVTVTDFDGKHANTRAYFIDEI